MYTRDINIISKRLYAATRAMTKSTQSSNYGNSCTSATYITGRVSKWPSEPKVESCEKIYWQLFQKLVDVEYVTASDGKTIGWHMNKADVVLLHLSRVLNETDEPQKRSFIYDYAIDATNNRGNNNNNNNNNK